MSLDFLTELLMPLVLAACILVGFIVKKWIEDVDNKWIPTIVTLLGAILACVFEAQITPELIVAGAITGAASTGFHQLFKQFVEGHTK